MPKAAPSAPPKDFESALLELERLVKEMEEGNLTLEQSLAAYKRGIELSAFCQKTLDVTEQEVRVLENGMLKAFKPEGRGGDV